MTDSVQPLAVAGAFYPAAAEACLGLADRLLAGANDAAVAPKAVIAPHAGYAYSGEIAASAWAPLARRRGEIRRVVLMAPNHRVAFRGLRLSPAATWDCPGGALGVDWPALSALLNLPDVAIDAAPFAREHSLEVQLPFARAALGPDVAIAPVLVGDAPPTLVAAALRRLWGGPETAIVISSDLSHYHDDATARAKDGAAARAIEALDSPALKDDMACGRRAIHGLIAEARARDLRATCLDLRNSGDTAGAKDRVVGYGAFGFVAAGGARLPDATREFIIDLAKRAVRAGLDVAGDAPPALRLDGRAPSGAGAMRAAFVTLTIGGQLRGCVGSLGPQRPLAEDVWTNAWKAAFGDPRFSRLSAAEFDALEVHVSILSTPRRIAAASESELIRALAPDADGLIIRDGAKQAIFLPSVWRSLPDATAFVRALKRKAGLQDDHWSNSFEAFRFAAESFAGDRC